MERWSWWLQGMSGQTVRGQWSRGRDAGRVAILLKRFFTKHSSRFYRGHVLKEFINSWREETHTQ